LNDWQGKPKYSEKPYPSAALSTTNPTCFPYANSGRRGGKPASNPTARPLYQLKMLQAGRKIAGSNPNEVDFFSNLPNPSSSTMALGSTQPLREMSTRNLPGGQNGGRRVRLSTLPPSLSRLSRQNLGAPTSHNPMGLHGLLQG
jgi:hypothetical protein